MAKKLTNGYSYLREDDKHGMKINTQGSSVPTSPLSARSKSYINQQSNGSRNDNNFCNSSQNSFRVIDVEEENEIVAEIEDNPYAFHVNEHSPDMNKWRRNLYLIMEDPSSSKIALIFNLSLAGLIIFSVLLTTIETIPSIRELKWSIWFILELLVMLLFTTELVLRTIAHSKNIQQLLEYLISPLTILDIFSIVPYYVMLLVSNDISVEFRFTILRVFRLFRLFRVYKYTNLLQLSIEVMLIAVKKSLDALGALLFFMLITIVLFSTFLYFAERGTWNDERKAFINSHGVLSAFDSIPAAFWFVIVTITTTGYGDIVPSTFLGKLIAFPLMVLGILLIALPSVIVGRNFTVVWDVLKGRKIDILEFAEEAPAQTLTEMVDDIEIDLAGDLHVNSEGQLIAPPKNFEKGINHITSQLKSLADTQEKLHNDIKNLQVLSINNSQQIQDLLKGLNQSTNLEINTSSER